MYLPSPLPAHDLVTIIHHSIVDGFALLFNTLLLLAVIMRSPASLRSYKVLLVNATILDLISSVTMLVTMVRIMPSGQSMVYVYDGPCAYVSGIFCHCLFTLLLATCSQSLFLIACSFVYRLYILGRPSPSNKAVFLACLIVSIPNLMVLTLFMTAIDDEDDVRAEWRTIKPEYALDDYVLEGHVSIFTIKTFYSILAMTVPSGPTLILIYVIRKKVLTKLMAHSIKMSGRTAEMHNTLTRVLTLQAMLPAFFSAAVVDYALCQFDIQCSPVQEHFIAEFVSYMALLSPMITLYCMKPYKEFVINIARCQFSELRRTVFEASTTRTTDLHKDPISVI